MRNRQCGFLPLTSSVVCVCVCVFCRSGRATLHKNGRVVKTATSVSNIFNDNVEVKTAFRDGDIIKLDEGEAGVASGIIVLHSITFECSPIATTIAQETSIATKIAREETTTTAAAAATTARTNATTTGRATTQNAPRINATANAIKPTTQPPTSAIAAPTDNKAVSSSAPGPPPTTPAASGAAASKDKGEGGGEDEGEDEEDKGMPAYIFAIIAVCIVTACLAAVAVVLKYVIEYAPWLWLPTHHTLPHPNTLPRAHVAPCCCPQCHAPRRCRPILACPIMNP